MRDLIQARLSELKQQLEAGQIELQQLQARENYLRETTLRISGAMQVLDELLAKQPSAMGAGVERSKEWLPAEGHVDAVKG